MEAGSIGPVKNRVSVALIGAGYWGTNLARVLSTHPGVELTWICDADSSSAEAARRFAPKAQISTNVGDVLSDGALQAIVIATPVSSHKELTLRALHSGKDVFVEKPMAATLFEAGEMLAAAKATGRILMVGHVFLYNAVVQRIAEMIKRGELGEIRYFSCRRLNLGIVRKDVDVMWDLAAHDVSILDLWTEGATISNVDAVGHSFLQPGIADLFFGSLTFSTGAAALIQTSWLDPQKVRSITVVGSKRMAVYDDMAQDARLVIHDKGIDINNLHANIGRYTTFAEYQLTVRAGDVWIPRIAFPEPLTVEIDDFVSSVAERRQPIATGEVGMRVVGVLERMREAMHNRGTTRAS